MRCGGEFKNRTHETSGCGTRFRIERDKSDGVRKKQRLAFLCEPLFLFRPEGRSEAVALRSRLAPPPVEAASAMVGTAAMNAPRLLQDFALGGEDFYLAQV